MKSIPSLLEISELCILGLSCAILRRCRRDQTMKAFIGRLMWSSLVLHEALPGCCGLSEWAPEWFNGPPAECSRGCGTGDDAGDDSGDDASELMLVVCCCMLTGLVKAK